MKITIISAHEGAATWVRLFRFIDETTRYDIRSFHQYDDNGYRSARSAWKRFVLRIETFAIFPLRFMLHSERISKESDLLLVVTSPFFMPALASVVTKRKNIKIISLMNDIYPEALVAKGMVRRGGAVERFIKKAFSSAFLKMESVVFITDHHRVLVSRGVGVPFKSVVIPVSAYSDPFQNTPPSSVEGSIQITYCGTLGLMHDTATFFEWFDSVDDRENLRFVFHTSGTCKQKFEAEVRMRTEKRQFRPKVLLGDALKEAEWVVLMRASQVGLVFQDKDSADVIFPSKVASILASGQAVLVVADRSSELARLIADHDCGWVVQPNDIENFSRCIAALLQPDVLLRKRNNAFVLGQKFFGKDAVAAQWVQLFDSVLLDAA
ncbi:MAG: glycosyltransferase family 4 protein [Gammaproteobacteria bacterium]|nr:glycosyltransferase family 4 protein [Gammaproteobacteria bacterium]